MDVVQALQRNEYLRYAHDLKRRSGRAEVITGTAGLFPVAVLREVISTRLRLPDNSFVYRNTAWTEDNELTTAIKHLGYRCASPSECVVRTELMPTWRALYFQRLRWQRGALDTLRDYGLTPVTAPYYLRQMLIYAAIVFLPFFVTVIILAVIETGVFPWSWPWFWLSTTVIFERVWTVRSGGQDSVRLASWVFPDVLYDLLSLIHI